MSWYYQATHPLEVGKPMAEVKKNFIEELPFAPGTPEQVSALVQTVDEILSLCQTRQGIKQKFIQFLIHAYEPKSISEKIEAFDALTFKEFCAELKKQKVKLSASQQFDLFTFFSEIIKEVSSVGVKIEACQMKLDEIVYSIYDLDDECIKRISSELQISI